MLSLSSNLAPLALAVLLGWTGAAKLFGRSARRRVAGTALERAAKDLGRAAVALRAVGAVELSAAAALSAAPAVGGPGAVWPGTAAALLGAGFAGYLVYGRVTSPGSSCGCSARDDAPIGVRSFLRAGLVVAGGAAAAASTAPWWEEAGRRPVASLGLLAVCLAVAVALFADLERLLLVPARRLRLRVLGHPLRGGAAAVPVEASVELLERSLAWEAAAPVVRSGLRDHWEDAGWRFLRYAGTHSAGGRARPVSVVFALDARADLDTAARPVVRVAVLDEEDLEPVPGALTDVSSRAALPVVT